MRQDSETPLFDGLGSARTETNGSGTVTATLTPAAFGQTVASTGTTGSAYGFGATSGYRSDGDLGLTHVGARYYDAQVGRFITRDTVLTEKPYAYCDGDPVNCLDPSGHVGLFGIVPPGLRWPSGASGPGGTPQGPKPVDPDPGQIVPDPPSQPQGPSGTFNHGTTTITGGVLNGGLGVGVSQSYPGGSSGATYGPGGLHYGGSGTVTGGSGGFEFGVKGGFNNTDGFGVSGVAVYSF